MKIKCPNCKEETDVRIITNLFDEERFVIHCQCNSVYTSEDKIHWLPVVISNGKPQVERVGREYDEDL